MVWSNGGAYSTWFSGDIGRIHGINILPMTAASVYLGRRPDKILKNFAEGNKGAWPDLFLQYLALADGDQAAQKYGGGVEAEGGDSKPHAYYQIKSLQGVGRLNAQIGASIPSFNVFDKEGGGAAARTYAAYNPSADPITVAFTDGFTMEVPGHTQMSKQGPIKAIALRPFARARGRALPALWNAAAYPGRYPGPVPALGIDGRRMPLPASGARPSGVYLVVPDARFGPLP
jgi:hypothetical protein